LRWANNTLTTNGISHDRKLTVIVTIGGTVGISTGVISRRGPSPESLVTLVRAAEETARAAMPAEDAHPLVPANEDTSSWTRPPVETSMAVFSSFAPALGEAFRRAGAEDRLLFGYAVHTMQSTYVASSTGLRLHHDQPTGYVEMNGKSRDFARSAWVGAQSLTFTDVDPVAMDAELSTRLAWAARVIDKPAGRYEVVLPPGAVADLLIDMYFNAEARDALDGRTVFSRAGGGTRVGDRLSEAAVTIRSNPHEPGIEAPPFVIARTSDPRQSVFDNGLPLQPTAWIDNGVLTSLIQTRHSAELSGLPVTPDVDNLIMDGGAPSLADMISKTDNGLLLTCLWYIRTVDPQTLLLTGLTRDGVYAIERGEVVGAVNNFRFNESPVDLLGRLTEIGTAERTLPREMSDYFTRVMMPPLRVPDFNMSSVSPAS
jgi:predicted Zn-dependent protease